jgi:hypothetical protein
MHVIQSVASHLSSASRTTINHLDTVRLDPNGFQKIGLLALAIFQGINCYSGKNYLPHLIKSLDIVNAFDFYACLRIPYFYLYPYHSDRIDPYPTLKRLEECLSTCLGAGSGDLTIRDFAKQSMDEFFDLLTGNDATYKNDISCRNETEFKILLKNFIIDKIEDENLRWNPALVNLDSFHPVLKKKSIINAVTDSSFIAVDIACGAFFLQEWDLLDLQSYANRMGKYKVLNWVPNQILDDWIRGGLCLGFALQIVQAARCLLSLGKSDIERKKAWWVTAVASTELAFNLSVLLRCNECAIHFFTIIAKGTGVIAVIHEPATEYFPNWPQ